MRIRIAYDEWIQDTRCLSHLRHLAPVVPPPVEASRASCAVSGEQQAWLHSYAKKILQAPHTV